MSIWLIGSEGMLGTELKRQLKQKNISFYKSDKEIDITDLNALKKFILGKPIDWIINCSAYTQVDLAEDEPEKAEKINAIGVKNIGILAKEITAKVIHISTDYVFNGEKAEPYFENDLTSPLGIYGKTKLQGELELQNKTNQYYIIRTAWLYGLRGNNFVKTMLSLFDSKDKLAVVSDQYGSPTFTKDLAFCILQILKQNNNQFGIYHFSNEGKTSWFLFARKIYELASQKKILKSSVMINETTTENYPTKAKRPQYSYLSKEKIKNTFSLDIRFWEDALDDFLNELKKQEY